MREILFRGKSIDGSWRYGDMFRCAGGTHIMCEKGFNYAVFLETVGQYTGLHDKNGEKIFEGDVVKDSEFGVGKIYCKDAEYSIGFNYYDLNLPLYCIYDRAVEVIGNIHDDPELLEEE